MFLQEFKIGKGREENLDLLILLHKYGTVILFCYSFSLASFPRELVLCVYSEKLQIEHSNGFFVHEMKLYALSS